MSGPGPAGDQVPQPPAAPPPVPPATPPTPPAGQPQQAQVSSDQLKAMWAKFEGGEKFVYYGAGLVLLGWILGIAAPGYGSIGIGSLALIGAIVSMIAVYIRHSPTIKMTWPAPYPTILLAISGLTGLGVLLTLLSNLSILSYVGFLFIVAVLVGIAGGALMLWGSYQLYQASRTPTPPSA